MDRKLESIRVETYFRYLMPRVYFKYANGLAKRGYDFNIY